METPRPKYQQLLDDLVKGKAMSNQAGSELTCLKDNKTISQINRDGNIILCAFNDPAFVLDRDTFQAIYDHALDLGFVNAPQCNCERETTAQDEQLKEFLSCRYRCEYSVWLMCQLEEYCQKRALETINHTRHYRKHSVFYLDKPDGGQKEITAKDVVDWLIEFGEQYHNESDERRAIGNIYKHIRKRYPLEDDNPDGEADEEQEKIPTSEIIKWLINFREPFHTESDESRVVGSMLYYLRLPAEAIMRTLQPMQATRG